MNCVLFAKMDQVFSKENKTPKKYWKIGKNTGKVREFCHSEKVGTLYFTRQNSENDRNFYPERTANLSCLSNCTGYVGISFQVYTLNYTRNK